jgi:hypothetical protein
MKPAFQMCIVRWATDGEGGIASRGPAEVYRDREEGYRELSYAIEYDDRFGIEVVDVQVSDRKWKALRK